MAFDYTPLASTAERLLTDYGQSVTFSRFSRGSYSPSSGMSSTSQTTYDAKVVLFNESKAEENDNTTQVIEIPAVAYSATPPKIGDTATINSEKLRVVEINPVQPATTVIYYELRLRS